MLCSLSVLYDVETDDKAYRYLTAVLSQQIFRTCALDQ
ncbi:Hypothetical protein AKI40_0269 [Enterobacter sp. FY-07]|nr:Hypothetical protein AKI40_0269 [Enterobacter sp. FY-07]